MEPPQDQECIFCAIAEGRNPSFKIAEIPEAVAVLELNPISKGHTLIISKDHNAKPSESKEIIDFTQKVAARIAQILSPKNVTPYTFNLFGHDILNILPVYDNETPDSPKTQATPEELQEIQKQIMEPSEDSQEIKKEEAKEEPEPVPEKPKEPEQIDSSKNWTPKRFP